MGGRAAERPPVDYRLTACERDLRGLTLSAEAELRRLLDIMAALRDPDRGCPWDQAAGLRHASRRTRSRKPTRSPTPSRAPTSPPCPTNWAICCSRSSTTPGWPRKPAGSTSPTSTRAIADKMIRRHPHVFGDAAARDAAEQTVAWEPQKTRRTCRQSRDRYIGRRAGWPPCPDARRQADGPRRPGRLRLAGRRSRSWQSWMRRSPSCGRNCRRRTAIGSPTRSATCCSCSPTWRASSTSTPRRACARPT